MEAVDAAVELGVGEHRLDHRFALGVERAALLACKDAAHERVAPALPTGTGALALAAIGRDQDLDAVLDDRVDLLVVPVAGIGERDLRTLGICPMKCVWSW